MAQAPRDENRVTALLATSSADGVTPVAVYADPTTHRLLTSAAGGAAPSDAEYVTLATNATLTNERVLTGTSNQITITDNGAGSTVVLSLPQSIATSSTPTFASMTLSGASSLTLGTASTSAGSVILKNATNANTVTIVSGVTSASYSLTLPTAQGGASTFLQNDGAGALSWAAGGSGTVTDVSVVSANGFAGSVATSTSTPAITLSTTITGILSGNGTAISAATTTGSGSVVLATSPTLVTPDIGVATATSVNKVTLTAPATGSTLTIADGKTLTVSDTMTLAGPNGTGNVVFTTSPTLVTPTLGVASATSINKVAITAPATSATLTISDGKTLTASNSLTLAGTDGKTLTVSNSITLAGTDSTTMTFPSTSATVAGIATTQTLTNKRVTKRLSTSSAPGATPSSNTDNYDIFQFTGLNTAITSMTTNLSGTPVAGDMVEFMFLDDGTARAITWGASFADGGLVSLPTTTVISTVLRVLVQYQTAASLNKWVCIAKA